MAEVELETLLLQQALELLGDFAVHARQDAVEEFDDRHFGAEPPPDRAEFEADDAGADDEQLFGHGGQRSAPVEETIDLLVDLDAGQPRDVGAGGDDDVLVSCVASAPSARLTTTLPGAAMRPSPLSQSILFFLNRKATPLTLAATVSSLCFIIAREIELGRLDDDAERGEAMRRLVEHFGGVEQRLRRDAADVEAGAAEASSLFRHGDFHPELRGADRADIAAGAGADDDEIVLAMEPLFTLGFDAQSLARRTRSSALRQSRARSSSSPRKPRQHASSKPMTAETPSNAVRRYNPSPST